MLRLLVITLVLSLLTLRRTFMLGHPWLSRWGVIYIT